VQVFTKNQQQWKIRPLRDAEIAEWTAELTRMRWACVKGQPCRVVSHASYLINLAAPDDALWNKSIDLMTEEIARCEALGIPLLVHHPGAFTTSTREAGLARIAAAYAEIFRRTPGYKTVSCLENTVGSGSNLGSQFQELAALRDMIAEATNAPERVGFCFDTCHAHAAGYDMASRAAADAVLDEFDAVCGLEHLRVVHLNDSKGAKGSRRDLHAHIGEGTLGGPSKRPTAARLAATGFAAVVNRPALRDVPKILETPKGTTPSGTPLDTINLNRLRKLVEVREPKQER
jgi:deoxyribonuclease-4